MIKRLKRRLSLTFRGENNIEDSFAELTTEEGETNGVKENKAGKGQGQSNLRSRTEEKRRGVCILVLGRKWYMVQLSSPMLECIHNIFFS